jgi:Protein of unknown function (DUF3047)
VRRVSMVLCAVLLGACASTPDDDPLVWSDDVVRTLPRENGERVELANFSRAPLGAVPAPWEPWFIVRGNKPTAYRVVPLDGASALEADSAEGGSGLWRRVRIDLHRQPVLEWRWRVPAETDTRLEANSAQSPPVRLSLAFHGDTNKLDFDDRTKLRLAKALTVHGLPYASLLYVWLYGVPAETVVHSPHTDRVRMIVVQSGAQRVGEWVTIRRNVLEDYRRAFGEEPDDVVGIGLMTDYGDDGSRRRAYYGDITFRSSE